MTTFETIATTAAATNEKIATYLDMYNRLKAGDNEQHTAMASLMLMFELTKNGYIEGENTDTLTAFVFKKD